MKKEVNVEQSNINWKGKKLAGSHSGTINLKEGYINFEDNEPVGGEFLMDMPTIKVTDLSGKNKQQLEDHLKNEDFFAVDNYPTAKLVIKNVVKKEEGTYGVLGDLTIKEKTNPVTFDQNISGDSASAKVVIDRSKFNVRYGSGSFFSNLGDNTIHDNFELDVNLKF
ncbi:YceI family protein [Autumnicola psychrophila]|uniref:YceI family protein n=1 Tax=Autumnicola psychrophila TaxID=3075592 RepID=A0ABU3DQU0_9FLAO|nr:YceI family protein [Zunongwangia sp. F225]MDT0686074.1 YceI family protein [Zunongwangia sp. F225]